MNEYIIENLTLLVPSKDDSLNLINNFHSIENYLISKVKNYEIIIISNGSSESDINSINKLIENNIYTKHLVYEKKGKGFAINKQNIIISYFLMLIFLLQYKNLINL